MTSGACWSRSRRKALHLARDERSQKRGGGAVRDEAALGGPGRLSRRGRRD